MNQVIRVADAREVLALVPFQLGYTPRESVVFIALRGERQRLGVMARADGTDIAHREGGDLLAAIGEFLQRDGAAKAIVIFYADGEATDEPRWLSGVSKKIEAELSTLMPTDIWIVRDGQLRVAHSPEQPGAGRVWGDAIDVGDLSTTQVSAAMVLQGNVVAKERAELGRLPHLSPELEQRVWRAGDRHRRMFLGNDRPDSPQRQHWIDRSAELWSAAIDAAIARSVSGISGRPDLPPPTWARLGVALNDRDLRDRVVARIVQAAVSPGDTGPRDGDPLADVGTEMMELFAGSSACAPDADVLRALSDVVAYATATNRHKYRADGCAILALLAWWQGTGARAREYCDSALRINRQHPLALLVHHALDVGLPPGWVQVTGKQPSGALRE